MEISSGDDFLDSLLLELRRSTIVLSVLSQLKSRQYGYSLVMLMESKGIPVEPGTLYPLLRRLEKQSLLDSNWDVGAAKPRKYYQLSQYGRTVYDKLREKWFEMVKNINVLLEE